MNKKPSYEELERRAKKAENKAVETERTEEKLKQKIAELQSFIDGNRSRFEDVMEERTAVLESSIAQLQQEITEKKQAEQALLESEERYRLLVETMNEGIGVQDENGRMTFVNDTLCRMGGYSKDEVVGRHVLDVLDEANQQEIKKQLADRRKGKKGLYELEVTGKKGQKVQVLISSQRITDQEGRYKGSFVVVTDISERKQMEEALRTSNDALSAAFQSSPDAIAITSLTEGRIVEVNDGFLQITGYDREEIIGNKMTDLNLWAGGPGERDKFIGALKESGEVRNYELTFIRKSGKTGTGLMSATIISMKGEPHSLGILRDITDFRRMNQELQRVQRLDSLGVLAGGIAHDFNNILMAIWGNINLVKMDVTPGGKAFEKLEQAEKACKRVKGLAEQLLTFSRGGGAGHQDNLALSARS